MHDRPVAVVTGSTRGIGRATARALARRGFDIVVTGRSTASRPDKRLPGTLEEVTAELESLGADVEAVAADLGEPHGTDALVDAVLDRFHRCDLLVNNAAISYLDPFSQIGMDRWRKSTNVNLLTPIGLTLGLLPSMLERGSGAIVNVSSRAAIDPSAPGLPYGVQKAGIERFTSGLATQLQGTGVAVVCVRIDELVVTEAVELVMPDSTQDDHLRPDRMAEGLAWTADHASELQGRVLTLHDLRGMDALG